MHQLEIQLPRSSIHFQCLWSRHTSMRRQASVHASTDRTAASQQHWVDNHPLVTFPITNLNVQHIRRASHNPNDAGADKHIYFFGVCQMTPFKVWSHTAQGCNHQSIACPSYNLYVWVSTRASPAKECDNLRLGGRLQEGEEPEENQLMKQYYSKLFVRPARERKQGLYIIS